MTKLCQLLSLTRNGRFGLSLHSSRKSLSHEKHKPKPMRPDGFMDIGLLALQIRLSFLAKIAGGINYHKF